MSEIKTFYPFLLMKLFKIAGDISLIFSKLVLFKKMKKLKTVSGLSLKWQWLLLLSYIFQFVDIREWKEVTFYNCYWNLVKVALLEYQVGIILLILFKFNETYSKKADKVNMGLMIGISMLLGWIFTIGKKQNIILIKYFGLDVSKNYYKWDLLKNIGIVLDTLSIFPQLIMIQETEDCEIVNAKSIFFFAMSKVFYLIYSIIKFKSITYVILGIINLLFCGNFIWNYYKYILHNIELQLKTISYSTFINICH